MAEQVSIDIKRGDTWSRQLIFTDENNLPIDITGYTIRFTAKEKISDADVDAVFAKVITVHEDAVNGISQLELSKTDTDLDAGSYLFDVQITTDEEEVYTVLEGLINISRDISLTS